MGIIHGVVSLISNIFWFFVLLVILAIPRSIIGYFKFKARAKKEWKRHLKNPDRTWYCFVCHTTQSNGRACEKGHKLG